MRRAALLLSAAALVFSAGTMQAQAKFDGKWTMVVDPAAPAPGRGGGGGLGPEVTITQDAKMLMTNRTTPNGEVKAMYMLDGSESKNSQAGRGGAMMESTSKAKWDGNKLVITTTRDFQGTPFVTTQTWSLDAAGNLEIETMAPGRQGGAPTTTKVTYKKG